MTDTERTEAEIVTELEAAIISELKKRWPPTAYIDWQIFPPQARAPHFGVFCKHASGTWWSVGPNAPSLQMLLAALRALPLPAETEHQCSVACVDELQELCDSESDRANANATTIHDLRITLRELAGIVERSRKLLDTLCGSVESVEKADQLCEEIATFIASHPELFTDGQAGEGEQPDGN